VTLKVQAASTVCGVDPKSPDGALTCVERDVETNTHFTVGESVCASMCVLSVCVCPCMF